MRFGDLVKLLRRIGVTLPGQTDEDPLPVEAQPIGRVTNAVPRMIVMGTYDAAWVGNEQQGV